MALTKVKLIADGVITSANLDASHGITTSDIGEGSNLYYTDARVSSYLSTNGFATQTDIVAAITDSAPVTLDTLNELAAALGDDPNFATTTATSLGLKAPLASPSFTGNATFAGNVNAPSVSANGFMEIRSDTASLYFENAANNNYYRLKRSSNDFVIDYYNGTTTSDRLTIDSSGQVEILNSLVMNKTDGSYIKFEYNSATRGYIGSERQIFAGGSEANMGYAATGDLVFGTGGSLTERMRIDSSGNLSLATATSLDFNVADFAQIKFKESGAITIDSDNNQSSRNFQFKDGDGSSLMFIGDDGNVGIGTTSPSTKLEVNTNTNNDGIILNGTSDNLRFNIKNDQATSGKRAFSMMISGSYPALIFQGLNDAYGFTRNIMAIEHDGNVGIGTITPAEKLHIRDASTDADVYIKIANDSRDWFMGVEGSNSDILSFKTHDASNLLNITSGGNVGIGVTPYSHYTGYEALDIGNTTALISNNTGTNVTNLLQNAYLNSAGSAWTYKYTDEANQFYMANGEFNFENAPSGTAGSAITWTRRLTIQANGNVGIGTTSPTTKLDVFGSGNYEGISVSNGNSSLGGGFVSLKQNGTSCGFIGVSGAAEGNNTNDISVFAETGRNIRFYTNGSASEKMRITSGGNVKIGASSTAPLYLVPSSDGFASPLIQFNKTDTAPQTALQFLTSGVTRGSITYTGSSTSYNTTSDYRLKENVIKMTGALDRVSQLKPSRFNFIADADKTVDGFLAHEVQEIVPEAISGEKDAVDKEGNPVYQGIDQSKLVPLLVGAIKELKADNDNLRERIQTLENQ